MSRREADFPNEPRTVGDLMNPTDEALAERVAKFKLGDRVTKMKGSRWTGLVVGVYSTALTPEGYAVESETETGSVQIYPAAALEALPARDEAVPASGGVEVKSLNWTQCQTHGGLVWLASWQGLQWRVHIDRHAEVNKAKAQAEFDAIVRSALAAPAESAKP